MYDKYIKQGHAGRPLQFLFQKLQSNIISFIHFSVLPCLYCEQRHVHWEAVMERSFAATGYHCEAPPPTAVPARASARLLPRALMCAGNNDACWLPAETGI